MLHPLHDKHFMLSAAALADLVQDTRERTLALLADLQEAQLEVPYLPLVNPLRWELGHIAFFYETFILRELDKTAPLMHGADDMYDSFKVDHADRWTLPLPSRSQTLEYSQRVAAAAQERLGGHTPSAAETYVYLLSVLHEDMHGEALTYMRQTLHYPAPRLSSLPLTALPASLGRRAVAWGCGIPGGVFALGATPAAPFLFDNEKWAHTVDVAPFRMARAPVTNAEFAAFVEDGGYERRQWWSYQGWVWRSKTRAQQPLYWQRQGHSGGASHFDTWVPLEPYAPVAHVTLVRSRSLLSVGRRRLPTEAEWEMAASAEPTADGSASPAISGAIPGAIAPTPAHANLDTRFFGCVDVGAFPAGDSAFGCRQMAGNVWEWTADAFYPFPGYVVDYPYREYSAPWFGYRQVLKGGAWATRSRLAYNTYRNFFPPARQDVLAGFRTCARA